MSGADDNQVESVSPCSETNYASAYPETVVTNLIKPVDSEITWIEETEADLDYGSQQLESNSETNGHAKSFAVTVESETKDNPAEIKVDIEQLPKSSEATSEKIEADSEQPSITCIDSEIKNDNHDKITEEDKDKILDIYEDLFKEAALAQEEEEKEKEESQVEIEEGSEGRKRCRKCCTCRCDCDSFLRAVTCNFKVICSKFCFCRRRNQRQQATTQQQVSISATNPVVEEQKQPGATEEESPEDEKEKAKALEIQDIITPTTLRARKQGWSYYAKFAFPLASDVVRDFWVVGELLLLVISLILSVVFFAIDENNRKGFNIFHLILTIVASILALIDAILQLKDCLSCRAGLKYHRKVKAAKQSEYDVDHKGENGEKVNGETEKDNLSQKSEDDVETGDATTKCQARIEKFKDTMDIIRTLLSEAVFYPLLICDLFEFITGKGYEVNSATDRLSLVLFLLSCLGIFLYVYLARILVLYGVVVTVHKKRKAMRQNQDDPTGLYIQIYFAVHVVMQMVAQILMIVAIAAKISYENQDYDPDSPVCESESPPSNVCSPTASSRLWYMFVAAYIMPVCGILTFYIVCYYWITELPLTVCLDFLRILESGSCDTFLSPKKSIKEKREKSKKLLQHYYESVHRDFERIYNVTFKDKLLYPFRNPAVIALSIAYAAFQIAFVICAGVSSISTEVATTMTSAAGAMEASETVILKEGLGWTIFFFIAAVLGALANVYVFVIAYFWVLVISVVIMLVILYVMCVFCELMKIGEDCLKCRDIPTRSRIRAAF